MDMRTTESSNIPEPQHGFCVFVNTICEGNVPSIRNDDGYPFVFPTREAAERDIAELAIEQLQEFLDGLRDFDEAIMVEEYVVEVVVYPDGSVGDEDDNFFGKGR